MNRTKHAIAAAIALTLLPAAAFAGGDAGFVFTIHGFYIIDFIVFVGIIVYFGRKPIAAALDQRYKNIAAEIDEAKNLREQAQAKYEEYKLRLERLEDELKQVIDDVKEGTEHEVERIIADAKKEADRIAADEAVRVAQEAKKIRQELAKHGAQLALELAEAQIREHLNKPGAQQAYLDRNLSELQARIDSEAA